MTRADYTAVLLIVDNSGSMAPIASDMEGAIATLLADQRALPGKLTVDYVRFSSTVSYEAKFADPTLTVAIKPGAMTALYDAIGIGMETFGQQLAGLPEEERPGTVLVAIVSDGFENASREYGQSAVKAIVERQTNEYGWNVTYLGANQDAVLVARRLGVAAQAALTYDVHNVGAMAASVSNYTTNLRSGVAAGYSDADRAANAGSR